MAQILIGDDDKDLVRVLQSYLSERNHFVVAAHDGYELSLKAHELKPDLIIADIKMPGAYGSTVYRMLQEDERTQGIPIIFISAYPADNLKQLLPVDPKTRFLQKPIAFAQLDRFLSELVAPARA